MDAGKETFFTLRMAMKAVENKKKKDKPENQILGFHYATQGVQLRILCKYVVEILAYCCILHNSQEKELA